MTTFCVYFNKMTEEHIPKKRSRSAGDSEDEFTVGELHTSKSAKVHGVMTTLSPSKASNSEIFSGRLNGR